VTYAPPSPGQETSRGSCETVVRPASTGPFFTVRGKACHKASGVPAYFQGRFSTSAGSAFSASSASTRFSACRNRNRTRARVPNTLPTMGKAVPLTRVNRTAGPPARNTRRWIAPTSSLGSTSASIRTSSPRFSRSRKASPMFL